VIRSRRVESGWYARWCMAVMIAGAMTAVLAGISSWALGREAPVGGPVAVSQSGQSGAPAPEGMAMIPAGPFMMGSRATASHVGFHVGVDEVPMHEVVLPAFYLDRTEVTNAQYAKFLQVSGRPLPADPKDPDYYRWKGPTPPAGQEQYPVMYVNWYDAQAYCEWAGKRLPTEEEWEKAARGTDQRQWPWGDTFDAAKCNSYEAGLKWSAPVGSLPQGDSPYGIHDMCGNVAEWTSSWYLPYPGSTVKRSAFGEHYKVARGGAWALPAEPWSRATNRNLAQPPDYKHRSLGFRCAKDAK
jgi:formylglycine-generating enzyme required for sulfatase activity